MFDFGINGYTPQWLRGLTAVSTAHGERLTTLADRTLRHAWIMWDHSADTWFADGPILLDFDGDQVEVNHQNLDALSITWNTVDPALPVRWSTSDEFELAWSQDAQADLADLHGQRLNSVELLEWAGPDLAHGMVAVSFVFTAQQLTVYNALDENGLAFGPPNPHYARHPRPAAA